MSCQPTSNNRSTGDNTVSDGLATHLQRVMEDAIGKYPGGTIKANLAKGHPRFTKRLRGLWDELAAEQALRLPPDQRQRPVWRTLNRKVPRGGYIAAIERTDDCEIPILHEPHVRDDDEIAMINSQTFKDSLYVRRVELSIASTIELTGMSQASLAEVFAGIERIGWEKCPAWVGPQLRLEYMDQEHEDSLHIAMEPMMGKKASRVFLVSRMNSHRQLIAACGVYHPDWQWDGDTKWVICRRK